MEAQNGKKNGMASPKWKQILLPEMPYFDIDILYISLGSMADP
jgi:hypothetical protein